MRIEDIANKAKVSTATVSRALNGSPRVKEKTAKRVLAAAKSLGYVANGSARSLSSGRSKLLGIIISDICNPYFPELISHFETLALSHSYDVILANTNYDPERLEHCVSRMMERRVEGVAIMTSEMHKAAASLLTRQHIPTVTLATQIVGNRFTTIKVDYSDGMREAIAHLRSLGHRDIAFMAGPSVLWTSGLRKQTFHDEMVRACLPVNPAWQIESDHRIEGGFQAMQRLLNLRCRPSAIVCSNDLSAMGALRAIRDSGLSVPEDYSLIGFDDIELASLTHPTLTTIRIPRQTIAQAAIGSLIEQIAKAAVKAKSTVTVRTALVIRQSTAAPRKR
jgi:LacI family transcriptional regulator